MNEVTLRQALLVLGWVIEGTFAGFWLGGSMPLAARGEENCENLTTKWCILKYI